jgi:SAM-dependent methyltransferase
MEAQNSIIQDYGKTVTSKLYLNALQGHQYIPQADQCIRNIIKEYCQKNNDICPKILDLGCGPGRLTLSIAENNCHIVGLDISENFITYANEIYWQNEIRKGTVEFQQLDFLDYDVKSNDSYQMFDVILMQGVMHHIHDESRSKFLQKSFDLLKPSGILIIGDEFIKDYESEDGRILNAAKFYLHIIDEAIKGGFGELAEEEAKNLIDDCFSGTKYAGHASQYVFDQIIYPYAKNINEMFYTHGSVAGLNFEANNQIYNMFDYIKRRTEHLTIFSTDGNFNRGDYKVSLEKFVDEVDACKFILSETYKIGPVDQLGGMGVLVFKKG